MDNPDIAWEHKPLPPERRRLLEQIWARLLVEERVTEVPVERERIVGSGPAGT